MNGNPMMGAYIGIGVGILFVLIMIIVIPRQIRKAKQMGKQAGENMMRDIENRTGLKWDGAAFVGNYKGYNIRMVKSLGNNKAKAFDGVVDILTDARYKENMSTNTMVYPTLKVWLDRPGANYPDITLFETGNFFLKNDEFWNNRINGRIPDDAKLDIDADPLHKKGTFYGSAEGAQKLLNSAELRQLMSSWIYPDLRADKSQVTLELNNPSIIPKWGHNKTSGVDWMIQGCDIVVAAAKALEN